jgi:hypothetical protein
MTMSSLCHRRVRAVILGLGVLATALAIWTIAQQAEPVALLAGLCSGLRNNAESATGLILGLLLLAVFNVAFWRHLRRAYASPRRRWRGDQ